MTTVNEKRWLTYFQRPERIGPLDGANAVGQAGGGCGDLVRIYLQVQDDRISRAAFMASGCPAAIAGAAACAELVEGRDLLGAALIDAAAIIVRLADLPPERARCVGLSATALSQAIENYAGRDGFSLGGSGRIVVGMSGGVDSATTAVKLKREGHEVIGVTLRLHDFTAGSTRACCTPADIDDAKAVAAPSSIPHLVMDMRAEFKSEVIDRFCQGYLNGRTPNPCVECNRKIRFHHFLDRANGLGAAKVATGHYARIVGPDSTGWYELRRAVDKSKDQSYMFWAADQRVLSTFLTPIGELRKEEVREMAAEFNLPVAGKQDSQDVCFVPDGDYATFVCEQTGHAPTPGRIVDFNAKVVGEHRGLIHYTVGQRRGLGLAAAEPMYVLGLDVRANSLVVGSKSHLAKDRFIISDFNLISGDAGGGSFDADVMVRYNSDTRRATIHPLEEGLAIVEFKKSFGPIAPGQSAVFYDGDIVLGGGVID